MFPYHFVNFFHNGLPVRYVNLYFDKGVNFYSVNLGIGGVNNQLLIILCYFSSVCKQEFCWLHYFKLFVRNKVTMIVGIDTFPAATALHPAG